MIALPLVLASLVTAAQLDVRAEVRGGRAPVAAGRRPEAVFASVLQPQAALILRSHVSESSIYYAPRLFFGQPNAIDLERPLLLHVAGARHEQRESRVLRWGAQAETTLGEVDYTALQQLVGPTQTALPVLSEVLTAAGEASTTWRATRRLTLEGRAIAAHRRPLGDQPVPPPPADGVAPTPAPTLAVQTTATAEPALTYAVTRRDDLVLRPGATIYSFEGVLDVLVAHPRVLWRHRVARDATLLIGGGVAVIEPLGQRADALDRLSPLGETTLEGVVARGGGLTLAARLRADVHWEVNPVLATGLQVGSATAGLSLAVRDEWTVAPLATFATSVTSAPLPGQPDETVVSGELPVRYRFSDELALELGGRYVHRTTHLAAQRHPARGREVWGYALLVTTFRSR